MKIEFQALLSRTLVKKISEELDLAGIKTDLNTFIGFLIFGFFGSLLGIGAIGVVVYKLPALMAFGAGLLAGVIFLGLIYGVLEYIIENRRVKAEEVLPDFLQVVAANIKSGVSIDRAMVYSARPEFEPISTAVQNFNKRLSVGESLTSSLVMMSNEFRSRQLKRAINLILEGISYGGGMVDIIEKVSMDLRQNQLMQKEISGQLFLYALFIIFASVIAAPALFAVNGVMIKITIGIWSGIASQLQGGNMHFSGAMSIFSPKPPSIKYEDYKNFSLATMIVISAFASFIVAAISTGRVSNGIKYVVAFIVISLAIYFVVSSVLEGIFSTMITTPGAGLV